MAAERHHNRSRVILLATTACFSLLLGGCGNSSADVNSLEPSPSAQEPSGNLPIAPPSTLTSSSENVLRIRSASGRAIVNHPLEFGRPFARGEISRCPKVHLNGAAAEFAQADVKTRHSDGSVQFAVISAVLPSVPATGDVAISFSDGACSEPTPLSKDRMLSAGFNFEVRIVLDAGASGTASAREMLSHEHYSLWTSGPIATTAIIADHKGKSYDMGPDSYKSLRPVFEVQFWPTLAKTRVRVILEAADTEKVQSQSYAVSVRIGASDSVEAMSAAGVRHNLMSRWTRVYWIGGEPEAVDIDYGLAYLAKTKALPNYDSSIRLSETAKQSMLSAWAAAPKNLYGKGLWETDMTVAGGRADLGPFPSWAVAWIYDGSAALRNVALSQADLAAAWPMHLREGSSEKRLDRQGTYLAIGQPVSGYGRPTLAYGDLAYDYITREDRVEVVGNIDRGGWVADNAHMPQPFYVPYLLTGEHFYKEQLQFWAGFSVLDLPHGLYGNYCYSRSVSPNYMGIVGQVRGFAWGFRMLSEAAWATPDGESGNKQWLVDAVEDVITRYEGSRGVIRGTNSSRADWQWAQSAGDCSNGMLRERNPLRFWNEGNPAYGSNDSVKQYEAPWQWSFAMYSLTRATELGFPADALRKWLAPYFVDVALQPEPLSYHIGDYTLPTIDAQTGELYQTWAQVHSEYQGYDPAALWPPIAAPGTNKAALPQGYGTVALTALASSYGVEKSAEAWAKFADNRFAVWGWEQDPKWAIRPRTMAVTE